MMTFGEALGYLQSGYIICRQSWPGFAIGIAEAPNPDIFRFSQNQWMGFRRWQKSACQEIITVGDVFWPPQSWVPTNSDILANDWQLLEDDHDVRGS